MGFSVRFLRVFVVALLMGCTSGTTEPVGPEGHSYRVLFVGNSLTYYNDLPGMVQALAKAGGDTLHVESVTFGGVSLEDHWNEGSARRRMAEGNFDLVVLQQGPSGAPESRALLIQYAKMFNTPIRASGARPAVYMVWPEITRPTAFDSVASNYSAAADSISAMLFPGIRAWQAAWARDPNLALYSKDGLHPTPLGTYAIAVMMVHQITGKRAVGLPEAIDTEGEYSISFRTSPGIARIVQQAAEEAAELYGRE